LLSALLAVVYLRADDRQVASWLEPTLRFIGVEMGSGLHGSRSVLNRLADILFIQAVHAFLSLGEPIGMAEVAEKVGYTSEAAFAKAFKRTLGRTPGDVRRSTASRRRDTPSG